MFSVLAVFLAFCLRKTQAGTSCADNRAVIAPKCSVLRGLFVSIQIFYTDISPYTAIDLTCLKLMC